jgi:hypothetical protein
MHINVASFLNHKAHNVWRTRPGRIITFALSLSLSLPRHPMAAGVAREYLRFMRAHAFSLPRGEAKGNIMQDRVLRSTSGMSELLSS